eukprot:15701033-Heterocapsa_arctica.AAC.1
MVKIIGEAITGQGHVGALPKEEGVPKSSATSRLSRSAQPAPSGSQAGSAAHALPAPSGCQAGSA